MIKYTLISNSFFRAINSFRHQPEQNQFGPTTSASSFALHTLSLPWFSTWRIAHPPMPTVQWQNRRCQLRCLLHQLDMANTEDCR